tara:strand:- start:76 stop:294 length:219 start_codon:yes stop_codon:yes gene_type:complete
MITVNKMGHDRETTSASDKVRYIVSQAKKHRFKTYLTSADKLVLEDILVSKQWNSVDIHFLNGFLKRYKKYE